MILTLRQRTAEMLAFESNPSRDQWRKLVTELLQDALRYQWLKNDSAGTLLHEVFDDIDIADDFDGRKQQLDSAIDQAMEKVR